MKNDPERDHRLMAVVAGALQRPSDQRRSFLQLACSNDPQLFQEAAETVEWEERMGGFLLDPLLVFNNFEKPFHPGELISGRFEIVREIGEGGMGVVYEAFDSKRNQRIAIKSAKTGFRRLLTPELESALKVRHPNICLVNEIHTAATAHGELDFLTMEFLDGQSLSAAMSSGFRFSPEEALEMARQLCAGLSEAHRSGIVHRDLKSANVILCRLEEGKLRAVITDFGLAGATVASAGELAGTPRYMAPELWRGEAASKASDIYALGVILYELVTGLQPFADDEDPCQPVSPDPPSSCTHNLDRRWDAAILSCLNPSPSARPCDAAEVLVGLEKKPVRKMPFVALALLVIAGLVPAVREPLLQRLRPAKVRLAILPAVSSDETSVVAEKVLQDVSERIKRFSSGDAKVAVHSLAEALRKNVHTADQVRNVLHATHLLQVTFHRDGNEIEAKASVIELGAQSHPQEFTGRYPPEIVQDIPGALAGAVSAALRLHPDTGSDAISPTAKAAYDRGVYLLQRSNYDQALASLNEAARLDPHSSWPLAKLAEVQIDRFSETKQQGYLEDARESLARAETLNPDSVPVHLAVGLLNKITGQYGKALEDYQRVQEIEPRSVVVLLRIADIYSAQNQLEKAIENCRKAISLDPGDPIAYQHLGALYYFHGQYLLAAEQFQKAVDRDHTLVDAYVNLGAAMSDLGRIEEAEKALLTSLTLKETARALNSLGTIRQQQGRDADAAGYYRRAIAMEPGSQIDWLNLGDSERRLGHLVEARAAYRKVKDLALVELQQNPHHGHFRAFVAYADARLDHKAAAEEEINEALHSAPENSYVIHLAVMIYEALGQRARALEVLRKSTPEQIQELDQERDLTALRQDPRFTQLLAKAQVAGR